MVNDRPTENLDGLDIDLIKRIEVLCRRFEADCRAGARREVDDYLGGVPESGRAALRAELETLERELGPPDETRPQPKVVSRATVAEAPTVAPERSPASQATGDFARSTHADHTLASKDQATIELRSSASPSSGTSAPTYIR